MPEVKLVRVKVVEGNLAWRCIPTPTHYIGINDALGLTVQADTWLDLMENIADTLNLLLVDLLSTDELERFLAERGWQMVGEIPARNAEVRFDIPFVPAWAGADDPQNYVHQ